MLFIFDCDGVLVDSEMLGAEVFSYVLNTFGFSLSPKACFSLFKGRTLCDCFDILESKFRRSLPKEFKASLDNETQEVFSKKLRPVAQIEGVLRFLKDQKTPICVASNGGKEKIYNSLKTAGLFTFFDGRLYSAEMVKRGKPAPDLFLYAAEQMNAKLENCWVIEDSFAGVKAALAANMNVILFGFSGNDAEIEESSSVNQMRLLLRKNPQVVVCETTRELLERVENLVLKNI